MSAEQNVVNTLQTRLHALEARLFALELAAKRYAFEACINDSWRARENFRDTSEAADRISDEAAMVTLALQEAYARLATRGRDGREVMRELKFHIGANND
jgi:hypothetical protein